MFYRTLLLIGLGLMATFGTSKLEFPGAGPLWCLTMAFVAALRWRFEDGSERRWVSYYRIVGMAFLLPQYLFFDNVISNG